MPLQHGSLSVNPPTGERLQKKANKIPACEVKAVHLPEAAWQNVLEAMGMPADRTGLYIEMVKSFNSGWLHFGNPGTEKFHGPTIDAFAQGLVT